jgi:hypothetical protein
LGEDFEKECASYFEREILQFLPKGVYFEKDNENVEGTKGDFIYRETLSDDYQFSIMFEMKNQKLEQNKGVKHSAYFKAADSNRIKKNCKYAIIVSTLEPTDEFAIKQVRDYTDM